MVKRTKKNELERRLLLERGLSVVLTGMLAMSVCGTSMVAFAAEGTALTNEDLQTEQAVSELVANSFKPHASEEGLDTLYEDATTSEADAEEKEAPENSASEKENESYSVAFAIGDASVDCNGATITGHQAMTVPTEEDLVFTVAPRDGFAIDDVSLQLLSEGVLDVLEPSETTEGAHYTVEAEKLADGVAIVVDTVAEAEESVSGSGSFGDLITPPVTGRTPSAKVEDVEKVYDGQPVSVAASTDKEGSTLLYFTDGMSGWSSENPRFTDVGTYTVLVKTNDSNDSESDVVTAHVTVKPASVVIKVRDAEKTVGSADPAFEGVIEGLIPGDEIGSVVYYRLNGGVEEVGSYADALSALVQHRNGNYSYTVIPGSFTIKGGIDAPAQSAMDDPAQPGDQSDPNRSESLIPGLLAEFAQGKGMQRFNEGVVQPIATLLGVASTDPTTVIDDETPLGAFERDAQDGCWVHLLIILGMFATAAGAAIALLRRLRQAWSMEDDLDEVCTRGRCIDDDDALPALDAPLRVR